MVKNVDEPTSQLQPQMRKGKKFSGTGSVLGGNYIEG
jgi:hypothetical protein